MIKKVGDCWYVAKSNRQELFDKANDPRLKLKVLGMDGLYSYQVIKYNRKKRTVSLIQSPDWYEANEPTVGDSLVFDLDTDDMECKSVKARKNNPQIYHSKWMMVGEHPGFDVEAAKERTKQWSSIPFLDKKRIGNKNYWIEVLKANGLEV